MGMMRKLFRPGPGQVPQQFTTAYINGTAVYPGDVVCWDTTAPASQAYNGATSTLGATDFIYVILPPAAALNAAGLQAGIVQGPGIQRQSGATVMVNDSLAVIQTWGVCPDVYAVTSTDSAAGIICSVAATTGAVTQALASAAEATTVAGAVNMVGFALNAQATDHTRATVATEPGLDLFVRCNF